MPTLITKTYEWEPSELPDAMDGEVKFLISGRFTRPIHMTSQADCDYIAGLIETAHKEGYEAGKDRLKVQLVHILQQKD